jgi:hypothetical protein
MGDVDDGQLLVVERDEDLHAGRDDVGRRGASGRRLGCLAGLKEACGDGRQRRGRLQTPQFLSPFLDKKK